MLSLTESQYDESGLNVQVSCLILSAYSHINIDETAIERVLDVSAICHKYRYLSINVMYPITAIWLSSMAQIYKRHISYCNLL